MIFRFEGDPSPSIRTPRIHRTALRSHCLLSQVNNRLSCIFCNAAGTGRRKREGTIFCVFERGLGI